VLSCLVDRLFIIELDIGGLGQVVTQDRLGLVQYSKEELLILDIIC